MNSKTLSVMAGSLLAIALGAYVWAGEEHDHSHAKGPEIDQPAPQFALKDVVTGEEVSLAAHKDKVVVVVFQSINCPWDRMRKGGGYQRVLSPLAEKYADKGVQFVAINSNKNESVEKLSSYHTEHNLPYPILKDPGNKIADAYAAKTTPHVFVIRADEQQTLAYMGGIEQVPGSPEECGQMDKQYLEPAINAVLNGTNPDPTTTKSKGCTIQRE